MGIRVKDNGYVIGFNRKVRDANTKNDTKQLEKEAKKIYKDCDTKLKQLGKLKKATEQQIEREGKTAINKLRALKDRVDSDTASWIEENFIDFIYTGLEAYDIYL